ncbi:MAG: ABC transporter permease [Nitrososphaerota archaeon]
MGLGRTIALKGATFLGVLLAVLLIVVVTLGATGLSDNILRSLIGEELREQRQTLSIILRDPEELERVIDARRQELIKFYGLDEPWYHRLPSTVWMVLTLDLGSARTLRSFTGSSRVADIVLERLPNTILLVTTALAISSMIGLFLGTKLATKVGSRMDRAISYLSAVSYALPTWWIGILLIVVLSFRLNLFPLSGMYSIPPPATHLERLLDLLWHSTLPILTLVFVTFGGWAYAVRTLVLNVAQEDFVNVARAKGLPEGLVRRRYVLRVAAPPIVTNIILGLAGSLGGAILTETVFNWPGMGRLYYDAVLALDETVIIALTFIFTLIYIIARFCLEVLYVILDPRVRYR